MTLPERLDDDTPARRWRRGVMAGAACIAALAAWAWSSRVPLPLASSSAPAPCAQQSLDITTGEGRVTHCVGATRQLSEGAQRSFVVEAQGPVPWKLRVDMNGERVIGAVLSRPADASSPRPAFFACLEDCQGFELTGPDAASRQRLMVRDALLQDQAVEPGSPGARSLRLRASLTVDDRRE